MSWFWLVDLQLKKVFIPHFHISYKAAYLPPPPLPPTRTFKFCITFVFHFSWVLQPSQEKLKTMFMHNFGGELRCIMGYVELAYWLIHIVEGISANLPVTLNHWALTLIDYARLFPVTAIVHCRQLKPCPHVSFFIWKRNFFFTDTASVHTYPMKTINENGTFRKRCPERNFLKTLFSRVRVDRRKQGKTSTRKTQLSNKNKNLKL